MGLDLWFREDIARILASTQAAMENSLGAVSPLDPQGAEAYQEGFDHALRAVGMAFGLRPASTRGGPGTDAPYRTVHVVDAEAARSGSNGAGQEW